LGFELTELAPEGVAKLFTVDVVRTTYLLDLEGAVVELAIDNGKIIADGGEEPIDEVELELVDGKVDAMLHFAEQIAKLVTVHKEERSKFARGLALIGLKSDY
jgi:triphosphatase